MRCEAWLAQIIAVNLVFVACALAPRGGVFTAFLVLLALQIGKEAYWFVRKEESRRGGERPREGVDTPGRYNRALGFFTQPGEEPCEPSFMKPLFRFLLVVVLLVYVARTAPRPMSLWLLALNTCLYYVNAFLDEECRQTALLAGIEVALAAAYMNGAGWLG